MVAINTSKKITTATTPVTAVKTTVTAPPVKPASVVSQAVQGVKAAIAPTAPATPVKPPIVGASTNLNTAQNQFMANTYKGGSQGYIDSQLARYTGANADMQGKIATDLARFGVKPPAQQPGTAQGSMFGIQGTAEIPLPGVSTNTGITETGASNNGMTGLDKTATGGSMYAPGTGPSVQNYNGQTYISYPDGRRELVDTPEEMNIANTLSGQERELANAQAAQQALIASNLASYNQSLEGLRGAQAVDQQGAQELQNRRGGFYSGGLDYQLGSIGSAYANQRGQLAQDFNRVNQELNAKYGAQTEQIRNNISSLLSSAPAMIQEAIDAKLAAKQEADQKRKEANVKAAEDFTKSTGYIVKPQDDYSGFWRQVEAGAKLTPERQLAQDKQNADIEAAKDKALAAAKKEDIANGWKIADQTGVIPNNIADMYGIPRGTETRAARQWASEQGLRQDNSDLAWLKEERLQNQGTSETGESTSYVPASVAGDTLKESLLVDTTVDGKPKRVPTTNPTKREQAFVDLANSGLVDPREMANILARAGYSTNEITALKKAYATSFQRASSMSGNSSSVNLGAGVAGNSDLINNYANKYSVDPALLKAIIYHETGNMKFPNAESARKKNNFGGMMRAKGGLQSFNTPEEGIEAVAELLGRKYKGKSIAQIGAIYAPIGASNDPRNTNSSWVRNVTSLYNKFK